MQAAIYVYIRAGDPEHQLAPLRHYAEDREWWLVNEFIDDKFSGREAWRRLMEAANQHEFDVILVPELAVLVLPHDPPVKALTCVDRWWRAGVRFRSLAEPPFQTCDEPGAQAFAAIASALASAEW